MASGSMEPTLTVGQHIQVQPHPYASPAQVKRGDVVVYEVKPGGHERRIKRIVALPGDRILDAAVSLRFGVLRRCGHR